MPMLEQSLAEIAEHLGLNILVVEEWIGSQPSFPSPVGTDERGDLWNIDEVINWYNDYWDLDPLSPDAVPPYSEPSAEEPPAAPDSEPVANPPDEVAPHFSEATPPSPLDVASQEEEPGAPRTYVLAEESGSMCLIPLEMFEQQAVEAEAAERLLGESQVSLADVQRLAGGDEALVPYLEEWIEEWLYNAGLYDGTSWDPPTLWSNLVDYGLVEDDDMPEDWVPTEDQMNSATVDVSESFYESKGLRDWKWADELPYSVVEQYGGGGAGMFGDYFGFDWAHQDEVTSALKALGHTVLREEDLRGT